MEIGKYLTPKGIGILLGFILLVAVADNINFSRLYGANNQFFTVFQFFGPAIGGFLGAGLSAVVVLSAEAFSFVFNGKELNLLNILRLAPMLFAASYFALYQNKAKISVLAPIACMGLFLIHPIGAQAWQYSLFWLIPAIAFLLPQNLLLRSYGATFSAHAIGGIIWIYSIPSTPEFWMALIPVVIFERTVFALGISVSYYSLSIALSRVPILQKFINIEKQYSLQA